MNLPDKALELSKRQLSILELQTRLELEESEQHLAFTTPIWARFSLPHRNPGAVSFYEVENGGLRLTIQPGVAPGSDGRMEVKGIPFGVIPRQVLTFLVTEAVQKKDPVIDMGNSLGEFLRRINISSDGGRDRKRVRDQVEALTWSSFRVSATLDSEQNGVGYDQRIIPIASGAELWLNGKQNRPGLWGSTITLSDQFFESVIDKPVPMYLEDLRVLGGSSLALDIYTWLTYRLSYLTTRTMIPWESLHAQFGKSYTRLRAFRENFEPALQDVLKLYTKANVKVTSTHLILMRSASHVPPALRR
jgi:hypothetical protein